MQNTTVKYTDIKLALLLCIIPDLVIVYGIITTQWNVAIFGFGVLITMCVVCANVMNHRKQAETKTGD